NSSLSASNEKVGMAKQRPIFACLLTALAVPCAFAQSILPEKVGDWRRGICAAEPARPALGQEAGLRNFSSCSFASGDNSITVTLGQYKDPSAAYEIYTSRITPQMSASTLAAKIANTAINSEALVAQTGDYVMEVSSPRIISAGDLQELIEAIHQKADKTPLPNIRTFLPDEGKVDGSQRYAPGPQSFHLALQTLKADNYSFLEREIGFDPSADVETMLARYRFKNNESAVLLALYPTPQIAERRLRHVNEVLAANGETRTTFQRRGSLLFAALNASSAKYADALRNAVQYGTSVTWNEGSHELTDPPITSTVVKIIIATGVFMLVAIVLGIAFGGIRIIIKRLFPGKVFDRPQDIEVLQMGLSGKKIDPTDFY
ncbi:MAG TPA: DUF6599 family protein, partial [Candidatus Saccharimonadales bacterium]|nr:DUF6599 family protein [Candidatus Saccharimonadales bacterium]